MIQIFDQRNKDIKVWVNGSLLHRDEAKVSVFDSAVQGGDAVWEGIRVYDGKIFCLDEHLNRLLESAKSMDFRAIPSIKDIKNATKFINNNWGNINEWWDSKKIKNLRKRLLNEFSIDTNKDGIKKWSRFIKEKYKE